MSRLRIRASAFGNPTLIITLSNGQDEGRTRIGDSCIAEGRIRKARDESGTNNECPRKLCVGVGGSEGRDEERRNERGEGEGGGSGSFAAGGGAEPQ